MSNVSTLFFVAKIVSLGNCLVNQCEFCEFLGDFMYNAQYPSVPPDIVFSAGDEGFNPLVEIANRWESEDGTKSSLRDWNGKDPSKLLALVHEIRWVGVWSAFFSPSLFVVGWILYYASC